MCYRKDDGVASMFFVSDAREAARVALALNFLRTGGSRVEELCLVSFRPHELRAVPKQQTEKRFICLWTRRTHWNVTLINANQERMNERLAVRHKHAHRFNNNNT